MEAVSETSFLPLYALAQASRGGSPILIDEEAVRLTEQLDETLARSDRKLHRKLTRGRLPGLMVTTLVLRIRHFDRVARRFLERHPRGLVVSLGAGFSDRRRRVDNRQMRWVDLDLPPVIELRRRYLEDSDRFSTLPVSVLDFSWMEALPAKEGEPILFQAEGLFMYLEPEEVRRLVVALRERFPGSELCAEVSNQRLVKMASGKMGRGKLRRRFGLSGDVWFHSGLSEAREMETWGEGITFLSEWRYLDEEAPGLGLLRLFRGWELVGKSQYVVHYRLGPAFRQVG